MYLNPLIFMIFFAVGIKLFRIYGIPALRILRQVLVGSDEAARSQEFDFITAIESGLLQFEDDAA